MKKFFIKKLLLRNLTAFLMLFTVLFLLFSCSDTKKKMFRDSLHIGIAEVNYTPSVGLDLVGNYRGDDYASRGINDSLYARAIVATDSKGEIAAILSVDICALRKEAVEMMRAYIASRTNIKPGNIMIHATHTHSGPRSDLEAPEAEEYLQKAAGAVILAYENQKPTLMSIGRILEDKVSFVRRLKYDDGTTRMVWEKLDPNKVVEVLGTKDPEMITLSFEQEDKLAGTIINFGCHPTNLTGSNWLYSADYPGYIAESLKKVKGNDFIPMFVNGCCGNVTQVNYKVGFISTYEECQRMGYKLGLDALAAMNNHEGVGGNIVEVSTEMVPIQRMSISDEQLAWAEAVKKKIDEEGMPPLQQDGIPDATYALRWIEMHKTQDVVDSLEVMVIRLGDVAFVGLPGEIFAEFGMEIKAESPFKNTIVMGLANDARAYFPTKVAYTQGPAGFTPMITGYETTPGTSRYEIGAGEKLTSSAISQLKRLY
jgi:neutral ceramidase